MSVDYDNVDGLLYYSDTTARRVYRMALNGTGKEIFLNDVRGKLLLALCGCYLSQIGCSADCSTDTSRE